MQLYEKYRPRRLSEVVGQRDTVESLQAMLARGMPSKAIFFIGDSGTGKDTISQALIAELGIPSMLVQEFAGADFGVDVVRRLIEDWNHTSLFDDGDSWRCCLVSEAHGITPAAVQLLLWFLERLPKKRLLLFTSNAALECYGGFNAAFMSRCMVCPLNLDHEAAAEYVAQIATTENLNGQPIAAYRALLARCQGNIRAALQAVESGIMLKPWKEPVEAPKTPPAPCQRPETGDYSAEYKAELEFGKRFFKGSKKHAAHLERLAVLK